MKHETTMDICAELRSHWPSQDDPELDDEDKCCLLLGMRAAAEIERLRTLISDLKAWDVEQYINIPHDLRARMQSELTPRLSSNYGQPIPDKTGA